LTWRIAGGHHDLEAEEAEFLETEGGQQRDCLFGNTFALMRLTHPISQVAIAMVSGELIDAGATQ
jgi:hypothetical protein